MCLDPADVRAGAFGLSPSPEVQAAIDTAAYGALSSGGEAQAATPIPDGPFRLQ